MTGRVKPVQKAKNILRLQLVKLLLSMKEEEKRAQSLILHKKLFKLPQFAKALKISCYCSTANEVDTKPIIEEIFKLKKQLYIPRYSYRFKKMYMERIEDMNDYQEMMARKGVIRPQPRYSDYREDAMDVGGLNLMIVNGLAFTKGGKRLGSGGGYYDNYIKKHRQAKLSEFIAVGLAFREQIFPYLPSHFHDVKMDLVLYPRSSDVK